jgi:hypothetical protein
MIDDSALPRYEIEENRSGPDRPALRLGLGAAVGGLVGVGIGLMGSPLYGLGFGLALGLTMAVLLGQATEE